VDKKLWLKSHEMQVMIMKTKKQMTPAALTIMNAADRAKYDTEAKKIVAHRDILAQLLKGSVYSLNKYSLEEIAAGIGLNVYVDEVPLEPGNSNFRQIKANRGQKKNSVVQQMNPIQSEIGEGSITMDIVVEVHVGDFYALIDVEVQTAEPSNYILENRKEVYAARLLTMQKNLYFSNDNYSDALDVYTIWIQLYEDVNVCTERTYKISHRHGEDDEQEQVEFKSHIVDVQVNLKREPKDVAEMFGLLYTLFSKNVNVSEKLNIMEERYHIPITEEIEEGVNTMRSIFDGEIEKLQQQYDGILADALKKKEEEAKKAVKEANHRASEREKARYEQIKELGRKKGISEDFLNDIAKIYSK